MKVIDLLNKIANNEEVPKFWWNGCIHQIEKDNDGKCSIFDTCCKKYKRVELNQLNDEIEIIEEETTYEQNFTGWKLIQNGKVVASYNAQRLKPVDIADVEKDVKEMLEEQQKRYEELYEHYKNMFECHCNRVQVEQLQSNWNELKKFVEAKVKHWEEEEKKWIELGFMKFGGEANNKLIFKIVLDKMQELEGNNE